MPMHRIMSGFRTRLKQRRTWLGLGLASGALALMPSLYRSIWPRRPTADIELHPKPRPVAALQFVDAQGRAMTLGDVRDRIVLLNIWATWCGPCREEMPTLDRLQAKLGGPDFEVLALSIDRAGSRVVQPFFDHVGIKHLRPYLDTAGLALSALAAPGIPLTLLIDRDGNEIGRKLGPATWDDPAMVDLMRYQIGTNALAPAPVARFHSSEITGASWGRDFHLTDHNGQPRDLQDFKGKVVMLFFGFTNCTDVCPTVMADLARVVERLGDDGARVQVLFVTVDPERDTPAVLAEYVMAFHPSFLGLREEPAATKAIAEEFKFHHAAHTPDKTGNYAVEHGSAVYVYGPRARRRLLMTAPRKVEAMASDVAQLLRT
jgi:protein SCO1/2